jgi:hypothetical protein
MQSGKSQPRGISLGLKAPGVLVGVACFLLCAQLKASGLVELQLESPPECPTRVAVESALVRLVQHAPSIPLRVSARFAPDGNRWVLFAVFENGQRVIPGDSCLAVAEALVVILALAIDPTVTVQSAQFPELQRGNAPNAPNDPSVPAPQGQAPATAPPPANRLPPVPLAKDAAEQRPSVSAPDLHGSVPQRPIQESRFGMSVLLMAESGSLPALSLGPALLGRYGTRALWGEISASALYPRFKAAPTDDTKGGRIGWFAGQLAGCAAPVESLPLAGCLGAELGDVFGYGVGTSYRQVAFALWYAAAVSAVFRTELRRDLGMELRLSAAVPFTHPAFGLDGYGQVFHPDQVSLRALAGISWR